MNYAVCIFPIVGLPTVGECEYARLPKTGPL